MRKNNGSFCKIMSNYNSGKLINKFFENINSSEIEYVLIKNIDDELPSRLKKEKDIDLLVRINSKDCLMKIMKEISFVRCSHPLSKRLGWMYLYGLNEYMIWMFKDSNNIFYVDVSFELSCKGLMEKTLIPLDKRIQLRIWEKKEWDQHKKWWIMDKETRFVYDIVRCIFDKRHFEERYINDVNVLKSVIDWVIVEDLFDKIFFNFTDVLIKRINDNDYDSIINDYYSFSNY